MNKYAGSLRIKERGPLAVHDILSTTRLFDEGDVDETHEDDGDDERNV